MIQVATAPDTHAIPECIQPSPLRDSSTGQRLHRRARARPGEFPLRYKLD